MRIAGLGSRLGVAVLLVRVASAFGAEREIHGIVVDEAGRPIMNEEGRPFEDLKVRVCGVEKKLPDGSWDRNHTPDCLLPRASIDKAGDFKVPFDEQDERVNLWVEKNGFAPTFVAGGVPQAEAVKVVMKHGLQVSGHVKRRVNGRLEPVKGAVVHVGCSSGDLAHLKRVFDDPYFFVMQMKEGDDLPYLRTIFTGSFGEYVVQVSPPPNGKRWFVVCLSETVVLDVRAGEQVRGPDFVVEVEVGGPG